MTRAGYCVASGHEPRSMDRAAAIAMVWCEGWSAVRPFGTLPERRQAGQHLSLQPAACGPPPPTGPRGGRATDQQGNRQPQGDYQHDRLLRNPLQIKGDYGAGTLHWLKHFPLDGRGDRACLSSPAIKEKCCDRCKVPTPQFSLIPVEDFAEARHVASLGGVLFPC